MASVTVFTAERMLEIEGGTVVSGSVDESGNLILIRRDETTINAGPVKGDDGYVGSDGPPGPPGADALGIGMVVFWPGSGAIPPNCLESGTTYPGGASTYTALAAIYPEWVVGADLIIPDFGGKALIGKRSKSSIGTATITIASPGVVTKASHGLYNGQRVSFTTTGELPTGLSSTTRYFARDVTLDTFRLASTLGGAAINTSGSQSGVHTLWDDDFTVVGESVGSKSHRHDFKIGLWDNSYSAAGARAAMQADSDAAAFRAGAFRHSDEVFAGSIVSGSPQTLTRGTPSSGTGATQRFESTGDTQVSSTVQQSYVGRWLVIAADSAGEYSPTVQAALVADVLALDSVSGAVLAIEDRKANATAAGTFTSGSWQKRDLNTITIDGISGASLSGSVITLPAGTYDFEASAPAYYVNQHKCKLRNTTDGIDYIGSGEYSMNASNGVSNRSFVRGRFTIAGPTNFELQHRCTTTRAVNGLGFDVSFGVSEIYSQIKFTKVA